MQNPTPHDEGKHRQYRLSLDAQLNTIEQEARMILPGIQAIFGFQLIAVFNQSFKANLNHADQFVHLIALISITISALLVLAPAAYHRESCRQLSVHFIELASRFIAVAMIPLAIGLCLDVYLVTKIISESELFSLIVTGVIFSMYTGLWFIFPNLHRIRVRKLPVHELNPEKPSQ
jgi:hypothetical protein